MSEDARDRELLAARARELAAPRKRLGELAGRSFAVFEHAESRYAIEIRYVLEVARVRPPTPLPRSEPFFRGVASLHGELLAVVDLSILAGVARAQPSPARPDEERSPRSDRELIMVLGLGQPELGLAIDCLHDTRALSEQVLPLTGSTSILEGATAEGLRVLDAEALLADTRLVIQPETPSTA